MSICFCVVYGCFLATMAEFTPCNRDLIDLRAYYLVIYRKNLPIPSYLNWQHFIFLSGSTSQDSLVKLTQ